MSDCAYKKIAENAADAARLNGFGISSFSGGRAVLYMLGGLSIDLYGEDRQKHAFMTMPRPGEDYTKEAFEKLAISFREMFGVSEVILGQPSEGYTRVFEEEGATHD